MLFYNRFISMEVMVLKKKFLSVLFLFAIVISVTACGKKNNNNEELKTYKASMETFFSNVEKIDYTIKTIDPDCDDDSSIKNLFEQFDLLEQEFKTLSEIPVPAEFSYNESLADEAYDYMVQANDYYHQSFTESSFNPYTLEAADECYRRANKRVQYIINILHGELPQDENVSYQ